MHAMMACRRRSWQLTMSCMHAWRAALCPQFTMFKVEEKKIKCGIPASGELYAMCFLAASDVMMAFKEVRRGGAGMRGGVG